MKEITNLKNYNMNPDIYFQKIPAQAEELYNQQTQESDLCYYSKQNNGKTTCQNICALKLSQGYSPDNSRKSKEVCQEAQKNNSRTILQN